MRVGKRSEKYKELWCDGIIAEDERAGKQGDFCRILKYPFVVLVS